MPLSTLSRLSMLLVLPLLPMACALPDGETRRSGSGSAPTAPAALRCAAMAQVNADRLHITTAEWIEAGQLQAQDPDTGLPAGAPLPAHCLLRGRLDERIGVDGEPYHTGFEMRLPEPGNGRLLHQGGSAPDGVLHMAVGRNTGALGWADNGLLRGFAAVSTDGGIQKASPLFGLDPQAREEHAWRAHWRTATTARDLFERFHGMAPVRSYYIGCSDGGRQGMMFTQRFPALFDGVVAVAPAMHASRGAAIAAAWSLQTLRAAAPVDADGRQHLAAAFSDAQLRRVADEVLDRCDAADGLVDGIVSDTALCRIDPRRLVCPAGGEGCLRPAQARALADAMAGPARRDGMPLHVAWPWDPGIAAPGWRDWMLGSALRGEPNARHATRGSGLLGFVHATPPDPTLTVFSFDFERDPLRLEPFHRVHGTAGEVLLRAFRERGGRLLLVHGMADPVHSARETTDYQDRVNAAHGPASASRFVRSFLVPGMNHCAGGPATDAFDGLQAIVDWVERAQPPQRIVAQGTSALPGLSRPLCPYPTIARYTGGDTTRADSFTCR